MSDLLDEWLEAIGIENVAGDGHIDQVQQFAEWIAPRIRALEAAYKEADAAWKLQVKEVVGVSKRAEQAEAEVARLKAALENAFVSCPECKERHGVSLGCNTCLGSGFIKLKAGDKDPESGIKQAQTGSAVPNPPAPSPRRKVKP